MARETHRVERVTAADGSFDLHVWSPPSGRGPGLLLLQEIFGVGPYIEAVAERLCSAGYAVGAPDVFWRIAPGWRAAHDDEGLQASLEVASRFDAEQGVADCAAAFEALRALPEVQGGAGVIGFCLGGTLALGVGLTSSPDVVVSYYGSGVAAMLERVDALEAPALFHFGEADAYIPTGDVERVRQAFAARPDVQVVVQPGAGHAFDNHEAPMFHQPEAARAAWATTERFLAEHLPA